MGDKDLCEKALFGFNDVFADVCNGVIFNVPGKVKPEDLQPYPTESLVLEDSSATHGFRDVAKVYRRNGINLLLVGLENQTKVDYQMVARVMLADARHYMNMSERSKRPDRRKANNRRRRSRRALSKLQNNHQNTRFPVVTYVLYFGYKRRWTGPRSLHEWLGLSPEFKDLVNDYKIHVIEVAWLPKAVRERLTGDFRILADALYELRTTGRIKGDGRKIRHKELFAVLRAITGNLFEGIDINCIDEGETNMDERIAKWIKDVKAEGRNEGFADGKAVGYANGEAAGYANGEAAGYANGEAVGYANGEAVGYANGEAVGYANGQKQGIWLSTQTCRDFGKTQSETADYLVQKLHLSREQADEAVKAYWQA